MRWLLALANPRSRHQRTRRRLQRHDTERRSSFELRAAPTVVRPRPEIPAIVFVEHWLDDCAPDAA